MTARRFAVRCVAVMVAASCATAWLLAEQSQSAKLTVHRQVDANGPFTEATVARTTDRAVLVKVDFSGPLTADAAIAIEWQDSSGKPVLNSTESVKAGSASCYAGILVAGRPVSKNPGAYKVLVRLEGGSAPPVSADFRIEAPVLDPNLPKFKASLGQGLNGDRVIGPTRRFNADNKAVWIALGSEAKLAAGNHLTAKVLNARGELVTYSKPAETRADQTSFSAGFYLAGRDWCKGGGKFTFRVCWNDDPRPVAEVPFEITAGNRWALLVGIKDYPPAGPEGDLPGCDVDVDTMKALLVGKLGTPDDHVTIIRDLAATRANIVKGLEDLAARAAPDDCVVFYYSGHGALTPDLEGDEADGWDEAIVPAEPISKTLATEADLSRLITDDQLAVLMRKFRTRNVTVIFDSCHSGTALRDDESAVEPPAELAYEKFRNISWSRQLIRKQQEAMRKRRARNDGRIYLASAGGAAKSLGGASRALWQDDSGRASTMGVHASYVMVASSRPWETSGCNGQGGFFTQALAEALSVSDGLNWEQIVPKVRESVAAIRPGQSPNVEGAVKRLPFPTETSETAADYSRPFAAVVGAMDIQTGQEKARRLDEGSAGKQRALVEGYQSVYIEQIGALYDVYPKSDEKFGGKPKGRIRITGDRETVVLSTPSGRPPVEKMYSTADIVSGSVHLGDRLLPVSIPLVSERPKIGVIVDSKLTGADKDRLTNVAVAIARALRSQPVDLPERFRWSDVDYVVEPKIINGSIVAQLWSSGGWRTASFEGSDSEIAAKVGAFVLQRHAQMTRLVRVSNPSPVFELVADTAGEPRTYAPGSEVTIQVDAGADCYAFALVGGMSGVESVEEIGQIAAGKSGRFTFRPSQSARGFVPVKIVATRDRLDLGPVKSADPSARVAALIQALRGRYGDGGGGPRFLGVEGWADATVRVALTNR